ncbi:MAG: sugar phosphate isomerase/epimerase, partial [Puniceicoccaceae bacterium]
DGPGYEPADDDVAGLLREAVPELERFGLVLGIENHDRLPAARLAALVDAADSERVGICLDTVNSFGSCEGPAEVVAVLAPHTVNLHLKDFTIRRLAHNMGFELTGTPAGRGRLRIPWLLDAVARYGRCTTAILELWPPPAETPAATIRREQAWVGESLAALRPHLTP